MCFDLTETVPAPLPGGPAGVAQLLDEHHLVVVGGSGVVRAALARALAQRLEALADAEVIRIPGAAVTDLGAFCRRLERGLGGERRIEPTVSGVVELLRCPPHEPKHQYFFWADADVLLEANPHLFGRLVNAFLGVAAEREHVTPDVLVLQRLVLLGGDRLAACADDETGPLRTWRLGDGTDAFPEVTACVPRPRVLVYRMG